jgi:D-apiose dehydrogenase
VHENFRFEAPMLKVKQLLDDGVIGKPSWARLAFRTGYDVYANQPYFYTEDRLAILDVGIHVLDLARVFFGEVAHISCETQRRNPKAKAEDTATMLLRHASGLVSQVECTYGSRRFPDPFPHTLIEIEGEHGVITSASPDTIALSDGTSTHSIAVDNPLAPWMQRPWHVVQASVVETSRNCLKSVRSGHPAATDIADNLKTFALVEAAYAAAASQTAQTPREWRP